MKRGLRLAAALLLWSADSSWLRAAELSVANVVVQQIPMSSLVEIRYDLAAPGTYALQVSVVISDDRGVTFGVPAREFSGDIGAVLSGSGKRVIWDAGADLGVAVGDHYRVRVTAGQALPPGMVLVAEGEFDMGSNLASDDERPVHTVLLDAFFIDRYEVTNAAWNDYALAAGKAVKPAPAAHPVVRVSWFEAMDHCASLSKRLPSEAEWEKAARGTDGRAYPWGEELAGYRANYRDSRDAFDNGSTPIGLYPEGVSPYGVHDMTGNVWEWVADWYDAAYYALSPLRNPAGPESGSYRGLRGGSWGDDEPRNLRTANRAAHSPSDPLEALGFRCARSASSDEVGEEVGEGAGLSNIFALAISDEILALRPDQPWLARPFPNPFNGAAILEYRVRDRRAAPRRVEVAIYAIDGRRVRTLVEMRIPVGQYRAHWDGTDQSGKPVGSGVYFAVLSAGTFRMTRKMMLVR